MSPYNTEMFAKKEKFSYQRKPALEGATDETHSLIKGMLKKSRPFCDNDPSFVSYKT
jgi:hypothetical protein